MSLFGDVIRLADCAFPTTEAHAHCDIPCGIYDPHDALQAAQTVIRMTELIQGLDLSDPAGERFALRVVNIGYCCIQATGIDRKAVTARHVAVDAYNAV